MAKRCLSVCSLLVLLAGVALYPYMEHISTSVKAMYSLTTMPQEDIDNFFKAYEILEVMGTDGQVGVKDEADRKAIHDLYKVLNQICAAGVLLEIMLLPPTLDKSKSVLQNIWLYVERQISFLYLKPGQRVLDTGSGRGKIAAQVAETTGANVIQINIDETQIAFAKEYSKKKGLFDKMEWHQQDFNLPYPYIKDGSIDAHYCAQACAFISNKVKHLKEMYRMLKPGGYTYHLEWLIKDFGERPENTEVSRFGNYDKNNATHHELVRKTGVLVGGAFPSGVLEWEAAFKEAGFELLLSHDPGEVPSLVLFDESNKVYEPLADAIIWLSGHGILPKRLGDLFTQLRKYWDASVKSHELELVSLSWEFVARKPLNA